MESETKTKTYKFDGVVCVNLTTDATSIEEAHKKFVLGNVDHVEILYGSLSSPFEKKNIFEEVA